MAIDQDTKRGDRAVVQSATTQDVGVLNVAGNLINPATEDKQDDIISGISDLDTSTSSVQISRGGNTVSHAYDMDSHETLKQILIQLQIMNTYLAEWQGECVTTQDI